MKSTDILVVVADRGRARLFAAPNGEEKLQELSDLLNPTLRLHADDLVHERQGRVMNRNRPSRTALGESHFLKHRSAARFAETVADAVAEQCKPGACERIFLLAEPEFLGLLRPRLAGKNLRVPTVEIAKGLTHRSGATIRRYLPKHLHKRRVEGVAV